MNLHFPDPNLKTVEIPYPLLRVLLVNYVDGGREHGRSDKEIRKVFIEQAYYNGIESDVDLGRLADWAFAEANGEAPS